MSHQVKWNDEILELFIKLGSLTPREATVMRYRVNDDYSIIQQAEILHTSESTINRITNRCKKKYDNCVKQYPNIFDPREFENVWK